MSLDTQQLPIPGSIVIVDTDTDHNSSQSDKLVLSPTPSNDVNDPLRWSRLRKNTTMAMVMLYVFAVGFSMTAQFSVFVPIMQESGLTLETLNQGTGAGFLLGAWGGIITQPLAMTFGKRGAFIASTLLLTVCTAVTPFATTRSTWIGIQIVKGFVASAAEMLPEVSVSDMFFAHERGFYIGMYALVLFGSNYVAPIVAGFIDQALGWTAVFYMCAIQLMVSLILLVFLLEETNYNRGTTELADRHGDGSSHTTSTDVESLPKLTLDTTVPAAGHISPEETVQTPLTLLGDEKVSAFSPITPSTAVDGKHTWPAARAGAAAATSSGLTDTPHSFSHRLKLFNKRWSTREQCAQYVTRSFLMLRFPGVFWTGVALGSNVMWYGVLNATSSLIFSGPPYNFRSSMVGVTYVGPLIGTLCAVFYSGYVADKFAVWYARTRRNGVREPEDRLYLLAVTVVLCPAGLILWGVGAARGVHWAALVVGGGITACSTVIGSIIAMSYALDCYKDMSAETMLGTQMVRNTMIFAVNYGITPWLGIGLQNCFISAAFIGLAFNALFVLVIFKGKAWRADSRATYWRYVETSLRPAH